MKYKFYVTCNWHDYPEGGTYGTTVMAVDHAEAERLCHEEMASCTAESNDYEDIPASCENCGNTDQDGSDICIDCEGTTWTKGKSAEQQAYDDYHHHWHVVDCVKLVDTEMGKLLTAIIAAWEAPTYGDVDNLVDNLSKPIQAAKEFFNG